MSILRLTSTFTLPFSTPSPFFSHLCAAKRLTHHSEPQRQNFHPTNASSFVCGHRISVHQPTNVFTSAFLLPSLHFVLAAQTEHGQLSGFGMIFYSLSRREFLFSLKILFSRRFLRMRENCISLVQQTL